MTQSLVELSFILRLSRQSMYSYDGMSNPLSRHPHYFLAIVRFTSSSFSNCPPSFLYSFSNSSWNLSLIFPSSPPTSSTNASCHLLQTGFPPLKNHSVISSGLPHLQCVITCLVCTSLNPAFSRFSLINSAVDHLGLVTKGALYPG